VIIKPDYLKHAIVLQITESWLKLTDQSIPKENLQKLARDMRAYCQLDTMAMVKIHEALLKL